MSNFVKITTSLITKLTGAFIAFITIWAFFTVKPLPLVKVNLSEAKSMDCRFSYTKNADEYKHLETPNSLIQLGNNYGQVIFIKLQLSVDIVFTGENIVNDEMGCNLSVSNLSESTDNQDDTMWGDISISKYFEVETLEQTYKDYPEGYVEDSGTLLLPKKSGVFLKVDICEKHCYKLTGAVRVQEAFSSEGITGIKLLPVNVYENSYLTARYECRLQMLGSKLDFLAPVICAFN